MEKEKKTLTLRIPQWVVKSIWRSFPFAVILTIISYSIAISAFYSKTTEYWGGSKKFEDHYEIRTPSFMGGSSEFEPSNHLPVETRKILSSYFSNSVDFIPAKFKLPLISRITLACKAMFSWKGLRFLVLMWILSWGFLWVYDHYRFSVKIISDNDKENTSQVESIIPESDTSKKEKSGREE